MFPLFETIAIEQGNILNLAYHQQRYEQSLRHLYPAKKSNIVLLSDVITQNMPPQSGLWRCRIDYDCTHQQIQFFPYQRKTYRTFQPIICDHIDYSLKYADRSLLNSLLAQKGECDEIMIIRHGNVTDCAIGNLIFLRGNEWVTPDTPLLNGTQRQLLLKQGKIRAQRIRVDDLDQYSEIRLINALNPL